MEPMGGSVGLVVLVLLSKSGFLNYVGKASKSDFELVLLSCD